MKKIIALLLTVVLTATAAVGGTLAYLTDRDSEVNTFTSGNVTIDLHEQFDENNAKLVPGTKITKNAKIENVAGSEDAYVWMTLAVPAELDSADAELGTANVLHWNYPGCVSDKYYNQKKYIDSGIANGYITEGLELSETWNIDDKVAVQKNVEIGGVKYNVYTFLYNGVLKAGESTVIALQQVYLDANVDINTDGQWYTVKDGTATKVNWTNSNTVNVIVSAYGIQSANVTDVDKSGTIDVVDAYKMYNTQWGTNGTEYTGTTTNTDGE